MKKQKKSNFKLKNSVNKLLFQNLSKEPPTRKSLMKEIKNIILTSKQLNQRAMDFNFTTEYKKMHKTMTKFNSEQNHKKNLVSKLSKENQFFTKSYPNIIGSLAIRIGKKKINYQTISNFNHKIKFPTTSLKEQNNFFYEDPLLLTKSKDLDNFYRNEKNLDTNDDESLNYSRKVLFGLDNNSPLNRVLKIIEKQNLKKSNNINILNDDDDNKSEINDLDNNNVNNIAIENQTLSDRNKNLFRNKNKFYNKFIDANKLNEEYEIKMLKKYNRSIKKLIKENNNGPDRTYTQKNIYLLKNNSKILKTFSNNNDEEYKNFKFNNILSSSSSKNIVNNIQKIETIKPAKKQLIKLELKTNNYNSNFNKDFEKNIFKDNKMSKSLKKKMMKMKKLKGSIQIQGIYKDLLRTKKTVYEYEKEKEPKFKYLYSLFSKRKYFPFRKEERENIKIKKLDHDLFWTVNEMYNN